MQRMKAVLIESRMNEVLQVVEDKVEFFLPAANFWCSTPAY